MVLLNSQNVPTFMVIFFIGSQVHQIPASCINVLQQMMNSEPDFLTFLRTLSIITFQMMMSRLTPHMSQGLNAHLVLQIHPQHFLMNSIVGSLLLSHKSKSVERFYSSMFVDQCVTSMETKDAVDFYFLMKLLKHLILIQITIPLC